LTAQIIAIAVCVAFSAYFSATETAFTSINRIRLKNMANDGNKKAKEVLELEGLMTGYNKNFYQESYKEFAKPKLIKTAIITFVIAGLITALFAAVWVLNPEEIQTKNKKSKK
jgi:hypothetical protein